QARLRDEHVGLDEDRRGTRPFARAARPPSNQLRPRALQIDRESLSGQGPRATKASRHQGRTGESSSLVQLGAFVSWWLSVRASLRSVGARRLQARRTSGTPTSGRACVDAAEWQLMIDAFDLFVSPRG